MGHSGGQYGGTRAASKHRRHDEHAGHDPAMFRRRFWLCLALTVPIVLTSHLVMSWLHYSLHIPGVWWVGPILGSVVFG